jgi:FixJ family two-component response regulator
MEGNRTVFVIDDDPGALRSAQQLLESDGLRVKTYRTGAEFLDKYDPDHPGCLVLDTHLPGMSGLDLQETLVGGGRCPPIIFVTDDGDVPSCLRAMKLGAVDFLEKPVNDQELVSLVHTAIDEDLQRRGRGDIDSGWANSARMTNSPGSANCLS